MRILIIGVLTFLVWSAISTYLYVCQIKGLCDETVSTEISAVSSEHIEAMTVNVMHKPTVRKHPPVPVDLVIYFAFDKSEFSVTDGIEKYFDAAHTYLNSDTNTHLKITGHTDEIGSNVYNNALAHRRAQSVLRYFNSKGVFLNVIEIESKGENEPVDNKNTNAGRANNRRTVITIK